ncbi:hypothetical protein ACFUPZ_08715 [Microbacterium oxydans]|uniref:hypothetical protein n=1 Tax=Microbacterium oxydans TaxID=82380 RepID=UPI003628C135
MGLARLGAISVIALVILTGCAASPDADSGATTPSSSPTPQPTPTIDPGPVALSVEDAGIRYLGIVCQRNGANEALNQAFAAGEETYLNGGDADPTAVKAAAAESLRVNSVQIALFDDGYYTWPGGVDVHIRAVRDASMKATSMYDSIANASSYAAAYNVAVVDDPAAAQAAQEIRYQLQLSPDTTASCVGYETAADALHTEMTERNEYLASFDN